jgi:hypothetical protein
MRRSCHNPGSWSNQTRTIRSGEGGISMEGKRKPLVVNGEIVELDAPACFSLSV